jgi:ABC-2 type transport system permease protein
MTGALLMAGVTFREAARRKILWTAIAAGAGFLTLFAVGMHFQAREFDAHTVPPVLRHQIQLAMLQIGFYAVNLLTVVMTILTSVDTLSGEIASGTIQAIATKPMARWEILIGKWLGFAGMIGIYVLAMFGGVAAMGYFIAGVSQHNTVGGALLVFLEGLLLLTVTFACGTKFSTLTNGVIVLGLHGLAFIGGWMEQIGALTESAKLQTIGIISSLIMPSEALWRRASYEMQSSVTRSMQFTPFSSSSAPSGMMVGYALLYLLAVMAIALYNFSERDL